MRTLDPLSGVSVFLAVSEALSFSKAAEALGMSRATVGAQILALERRLGVRLLQRTTRAVALTEAGETYRQALAGLRTQVVEAERAAVAHQTEAVGRLRISVPPDLAAGHIAPIVAQFLIRNPAMSIELHLSNEATDLVRDGFDLAVRGALAVEPNVVTRQVGLSPIAICAAPSYLARHGAPAGPEDLARHACLHFVRLRWGRVWHLRKGDETFRVPIVPRLEANEGQTLRQAAVEGAGLVLVPMFVAGPAIRAGHLVPVLTDYAAGEVPLHAVFPNNRQIAQKVRSFVAALATGFVGHPDLGGRADRSADRDAR